MLKIKFLLLFPYIFSQSSVYPWIDITCPKVTNKHASSTVLIRLYQTTVKAACFIMFWIFTATLFGCANTAPSSYRTSLLSVSKEYRECWDELGPRNYDLDIQVVCHCSLSGHYRYLVRDGHITLIEIPATETARSKHLAGFSIESIFDEIEQALSGHLSDANVIFHPYLLYPVATKIDNRIGAVDDEIWYFIELKPPTGHN